MGMKSYGRAPTFLMATGYEQVRSIAAALAGDREAAERVELVLPETGVCSTDLGGSCSDAPAAEEEAEASCCAATGAGAGAGGARRAVGAEPAVTAEPESVPAPAADASSCCAAPEPAFLGIPTGLAHGRSAREES